MRTLTISARHLAAAIVILAATGVASPQEVIFGIMTMAPVPINKPDPEYTPEARAANLQGSVVISTLIGVDGVPTEIKVIRSLGMGLDEKAIECVQRWRFKPATRDGEPIPLRANIELNFRLPESNPPTAR